ncbi:hypothetical protein EDB92DRAFT_1859126 [Lactarius akahatsu]|uniref:Uncharacterized protein n=1 Tax=Lactarius akahatsu TaxID=416441 RepID=A0AAD4QDR9_9AGAM|nr:hypothetical protein EDB92DRAFT_1859126 [Lactarius akahatsu]
MRLPSSSSLLLASLAVSASSSSSLSALAAPAGDSSEDSPLPAPVAHCDNGVAARSHDHLQSRGAVGDTVVPIVDPLFKKIVDIIRPLNVHSTRDSESAAPGDSNDPESPTTQPPAPPSTPAVPAKALVNPPETPASPPEAPVSPPAAPVNPPAAPVNPSALPELPVRVPVGRRASIGDVGAALT